MGRVKPTAQRKRRHSPVGEKSGPPVGLIGPTIPEARKAWLKAQKKAAGESVVTQI